MSTIKHLLASLFALVIVVAAHPAMAQTTGPNGGLLGGKDDHQTELLVTPTELIVYLIHNGKVDDIKGVSIRAVIQEGGANTSINFSAVEAKRFVAKLATPLGKGAIVAITGKDHHGHAITARYVID